MGLESATYISGLTSSWPIGSDLKAQGDDHLRLIKGALQATFPTATKPFRFPASIDVGNVTLTASHQNGMVFISTASGNGAVTLPTLAVADDGWSVSVMKYTTDANAIIVTPASGTVITESGSVATVRVGIVCSPAWFYWSGFSWFCVKNGPPVGSTINIDVSSTLPGYLLLDGSSFSSGAFAELAAVLGTTTLKDKRGRTEVGLDGAGRLTGYVGATLGSTGGSSSHTLTIAELAAHDHGANVTDTHTHSYDRWNQGVGGGTGVAGFLSQATALTSTQTGTKTGTISVDVTDTGSGSAHANVQPTIVTNKLIRAC